MTIYCIYCCSWPHDKLDLRPVYGRSPLKGDVELDYYSIDSNLMNESKDPDLPFLVVFVTHLNYGESQGLSRRLEARCACLYDA